jgi:hypothetical protein
MYKDGQRDILLHDEVDDVFGFFTIQGSRDLGEKERERVVEGRFSESIFRDIL